MRPVGERKVAPRSNSGEAAAERGGARGVPLDARRAQRREALIRAAIEVYGARGFRNATVKAVCEAAGLTERYFYESFANGEALLVAALGALTAPRSTRLLPGSDQFRRLLGRPLNPETAIDDGAARAIARRRGRRRSRSR
jgi:AcrR family transcriptional regulator